MKIEKFWLRLPKRTKAGLVLGAASLLLVAALSLKMRSRPGSNEPEPEERPAPSVILSTGSFTLPLNTILMRSSLTSREAFDIGQAFKSLFDPRTLRESDRYRLTQSTAGAFQEITVFRDLTEYTVQRSTPKPFSASVRQTPLSLEERNRSGVLTESLWESMRGENLTADLIMDFADVFAWTIDFLTEPRAGDRYALVWENQSTSEGETMKRKIVAALYEGRQTGRHAAVYFKGDYYDEEGRSLRKAFLHAPLNFRRISSGFTYKRFHPILRYFRPHLGIDYAAPMGTPVVSIGDGTVIYKGWKGGFGNYVEVRHNSAYTTCYGHFSRFAKIRVGQHVEQKQVVGYVGQTGHATGPHLDFRVRKNGSYVNFLTLKFPSEKNVPASEKQAFMAVKDKRMLELGGLLKEKEAKPQS